MTIKIGEIIIDDKGYSPRHESILEGGNIKFINSAKMVVYENTVENLLGHLHWMTQFVKWQIVDDQLKDWRK